MSAPHINLSFVLSVCQKLSKSVDIGRISDKNNFAQLFFETRDLLYGIS